VCIIHTNIKRHYRFKFVNNTANQFIRMISEGLCDTGEWSNDDENSTSITGINYFLKYIQRKSVLFE